MEVSTITQCPFWPVPPPTLNSYPIFQNRPGIRQATDHLLICYVLPFRQNLSEPIPPFHRSAVLPFQFLLSYVYRLPTYRPTRPSWLKQAYVGIQYGNLEAMPEGMRATEFGTGVLKRFKMRRVNEKQKKGKNPCKGIHYDFLKEWKRKKRARVGWYKSRLCKRIFVKEFGTIFSTAEGPIDYRCIVHYGLRRIWCIHQIRLPRRAVHTIITLTLTLTLTLIFILL